MFDTLCRFIPETWIRIPIPWLNIINMTKYNFTEEELKTIIDDYVNNWLSIKEIGEKYNIKSKERIKKILGDNIRTSSEASKIAHQKHPDKFKLSDDAKDKIRKARLKFMKEHPEETAWRKRNEPSYPEKMFIKFLEEKGYSDKYYIEREYSIFPFYIDFAFIDLKIAVEIDGSQHLEEERQQKDIEKDKLLQDNGWTVIRIAENVIRNDWDILEQTLNKYINKESIETFEKVGIVKHVAKSKVNPRNINGKTEKQQKRKDDFLKSLPDKDVLLKEIIEYSFEEVGRIHNVTGNAIKKWCKNLGLPSTKRELGQKSNDKIPNRYCDQCGKLYHPKDRNSKFCSKKCNDQYSFENSKWGHISLETVNQYINDKIKISIACKELGITRQNMYSLCEHYGIKYKI